MMKTMKKCLAAILTAVMLASLVPVPSMAAPKAKKLSLSKKDITMEVDDVITIKSKGKANVKAKISPKKAKQDIKVTSSDKDVVKVKRINKYGYRLTAVDEGEATITVRSLSNKKLKKKLNITVTVPEEEEGEDVVVDNPVVTFSMSARQSAEDRLEVMFTQEVPDTLALSSFSLRDKTGNSDVALKSFTLGADKRSGEIQSHITFNTGSIYELSYRNLADGKTYTAEINAKKGDVASLKLLTVTVPAGIDKKLNFAIYDMNGVDVTSSYKNYVTLSADIPAGKGFFNPATNEIRMFEPGITAKITMTYQEGLKKVEGTGVLSVTSQSTETVSIDTWSLYQTAAVDWNMPNNVPTITMGANTLDFSVDAKVRTSDGKNFKSDTDPGFTFKSSNEAVFKMLGHKIIPLTKGTAALIVEFMYEGKTSQFTPVTVTVGEDAKPAMIVLNKDSVMVKKGQTDDTIKMEMVKDQYGNIIDTAAGAWAVTVDPAVNAPTVTYDAATGKITADATGAGVEANKNYSVTLELSLGGNKLPRKFGVIVTP